MQTTIIRVPHVRDGLIVANVGGVTNASGITNADAVTNAVGVTNVAAVTKPNQAATSLREAH